MIKCIKGNLAAKTPTEVLIEVGGVGLAVHIPLSTYSALPEIGRQTKLSTYLHVREDQLKLYGFASKEECDLFTLLIGVNKIGPGVALQVLSSCKVNEFRELVGNGDTKSLSSMIKGVGKKTAERMIVELKDKIGDFAQSEGSQQDSSVAPDAVKALVELGSTPAAARNEVKKAIEKTGSDASVDIILRTVFDNR